jgi:hypothetical protein
MQRSCKRDGRDGLNWECSVPNRRYFTFEEERKEVKEEVEEVQDVKEMEGGVRVG